MTIISVASPSRQYQKSTEEQDLVRPISIAVRRPCVLAILKIFLQQDMVCPLLIAVRRPCLLRRMCYSGFFRCCAVRAALAPSETRPGGASLRSAAPGRVPSQALSNAPSAAFIARPPPHPSHSCACEGPSARKTLRRPRRSKGYAHWTSIGSLPVLVLVWVAGASPRKAEGFFGLPARTRSGARGVEVAGVKNAAVGAFFRACKGDSTLPKARWADEGASPSPDTGTSEKPGVARAAKQARASHRD